MANRTFMDQNFSLVKRMVHLFCSINVPEGAAASVALQKWNYPTLGQGPNARTYTAATTPGTTPPANAGIWPEQYQAGSEGVFSVVRTATGLYTLKLQDNYQRLLFMDAHASVAAGTPTFAKLTENTTISSYGTGGGSVIGLAFWDFAGVAVDPIGQVRLALILQDATEP